MTKPEKKPNKGWAKFAGIDQIDWLIIVVAVLVSTVARYHHWFGDAPGWFLDFVLPMGMIVVAYKVRAGLRTRRERLEWAKRWPLDNKPQESAREEKGDD
jgi:hypothetical protein